MNYAFFCYLSLNFNEFIGNYKISFLVNLILMDVKSGKFSHIQT